VSPFSGCPRSGSDRSTARRASVAPIPELARAAGSLSTGDCLAPEVSQAVKRVLASDRDELTEATRAVLASFKGSQGTSEDGGRIARRAGLTPGQVIIDVPLPELLLSEPRIAKTEVPILDDGNAKPFSRVSSLGRAFRFVKSSTGS